MRVVIHGVPGQANLSEGAPLGGGTWDVTGVDLDTLAFHAGENIEGQFTLALETTVHSTEDDSERAQRSEFDVTVGAELDGLGLGGQDSAGLAGTTIPLELSLELFDTDGSEWVESMSLSGLPASATLTVGQEIGDGVWSIPVDQMDQVAVTTGSDEAGSYTLNFSAVLTQADGQSLESHASFQLVITADEPPRIEPTPDPEPGPSPEPPAPEPAVSEEPPERESRSSEAQAAQAQPVDPGPIDPAGGTEAKEREVPERAAEPLSSEPRESRGSPGDVDLSVADPATFTDAASEADRDAGNADSDEDPARRDRENGAEDESGSRSTGDHVKQWVFGLLRGLGGMRKGGANRDGTAKTGRQN